MTRAGAAVLEATAASYNATQDPSPENLRTASCAVQALAGLALRLERELEQVRPTHETIAPPGVS